MTRESAVPYTAARIFKMPAIIAVVSFAGLLLALIGDGIFDVLAWLALGTPIAVLAVILLQLRRHRL